jgi:hypothetical protein
MQAIITCCLAALPAALLGALSQPAAGRLRAANASGSVDACRSTKQYVFACIMLYTLPTARNGVQ